MKEFFSLLGSLLIPATGFMTNLLTGRFGWGQTLNLVKQFVFQFVFVVMFMSVSTTGTFFTAAALTLVHMGCAFLILTMLLGSAFSANFGARDQLDFGRQSLLVAIAITSVPTALILDWPGSSVHQHYLLRCSSLSSRSLPVQPSTLQPY